jgi:hypothetical protein
MSAASIKNFEYVLRDLAIMAFESLWHFLEKRANRFKNIQW